MPAGARRLLARLRVRPARRALLVAGLWLAAPVAADQISSARYANPTPRYAHGVLGDAIEHGTLVLTLDTGATLRMVLPETLVFEDTAPRLADLDGDGAREVIVVESSLTQGARLAVYDVTGRIAATPHIGRSNRWLAPVGAADLDGDGTVELAYIDRPHLAKTLRLWRYEAGALSPVGDLAGYTNHRIGERDIAGGIRTCAGAPELIVATADWTRIVALRWSADGFTQTDLGSHEGRHRFAAALACAE
ncbi:FG-GAP repeat domain-containing protein [Sulfitobacter sabulilitoris]|uniref:VCBS repeat-containing protein n=1 Tax=Sulfitobacter sabulilitoris TaxID=2562655 RepID=A0A5S3PD86_9RHOB|nr:VCBS repeat-containing protein [Sulfitobacter sabulilitoris]TMM50817.1 VCBS repeat-containing protein [Sulfitobacter sabulilitoris]